MELQQPDAESLKPFTGTFVDPAIVVYQFLITDCDKQTSVLNLHQIFSFPFNRIDYYPGLLGWCRFAFQLPSRSHFQLAIVANSWKFRYFL
jgi:hypothetical protein